jgi:predicted hydrolase (HD superfamily)
MATKPRIGNSRHTLDTRNILEYMARLDEEDEDEKEELGLLQALIEEVRDNSEEDPKDGCSLIRYDYFVEYAQELAEDIGAISGEHAGLQWPLNCIDWEQAADQLKEDYNNVNYDGVTYWVR